MLVAIDAVGIRGYGGAAILNELLRWLPHVRPEWRWHVFLLERKLREFDDPPVPATVTIEHTELGHTGIGRLSWIVREVPKRLQQLRADVVFSFANIGASRPRVPQVLYYHQHLAVSDSARELLAPLARLRMRFLRFCLAKASRATRAIIVQTPSMKTALAQVRRGIDQKVHVIPGGYRTASNCPVIRSEKKELTDCTTGPLLTYVAQPVPHKNHVAIVRAMPQILRECPAAKLLLTLESSLARNEVGFDVVRDIRRLAQRLGVTGSIIFAGVLTPDEVDYTLRKSTLLAFPSLSESFGLPMVEAMAVGCPIAAADLPYAHDVAGPAGAYFDPRDPASLASTVVSVLRSPDALHGLKVAARLRKHLFAYPQIAERIATVLDAAACSAPN
jgi:glycosyltransferase involved in cell wall biosynthesis